MYLINKNENKITRLQQQTFSELGFREREHLQEWLVDNPEALGEELLIIQKEFSGFNDTNERLDLLTLDKQGNLVIIENKLDDSGRDVTWQALKYASYCSSFKKEEIKDIYQEYLDKSNHGGSAEDNISEFLDGQGQEYEEMTLNQGYTQRIMMVAGKFRKEVTSTVHWLSNFNIRIQCFKVTPYSLGEQLFLNIEQILPIKDVEEFVISMASKVQGEIATQESLKNRHIIRMAFWKEYLIQSNQSNELFSNISPSKDAWIGIGMGMTGISLNIVITKKHCRSEIYFNRGSQTENKECFDFLFEMKDQIEESFHGPLLWERLDEKVSCRVRSQLDEVNIFEQEDWPKMIEFLIDSSTRMHMAFSEPVKKLNRYMRGK